MSSSNKFKNRKELETALRAEIQTEEPQDTPPGTYITPERRKCREAAAVIGPFAPEDLQTEINKAGETINVVEIAPDCDVVAGGNWLLQTSIRRLVLEQLAANRSFSGVFNKTRGFKNDSYRKAFEEIASGKLTSLKGRSIEELRHLKQVQKWFGDVAPVKFDLKEIDRAIDAREIVEPFYKLAYNFRGRKAELEELRDFVEVYEASHLFEGITRGVKGTFGIRSRPPQVIWGPGGIGKSALISRFILEHAEIGKIISTEVENHAKIPFAYLDFDRVELDPLRPESLLTEIAAQLLKQYPDDDFQQETTSWIQQIQRTQRRGPRTGPYGPREINIKSDNELTKYILKRLGQWFNEILSQDDTTQPPLLLVFDTFEEIQLGGEAREREAVEFVHSFQKLYPRLRLVICGRAKVRYIRAVHIELKDLDKYAAHEMLVDWEIKEPKLRDEIISRVGTNPLSLILAAQVLIQENKENQMKVLSDIRTRNLVFQRIDAAEIQGQLYDRILKHVRDLKVRKLAYPGLIVRRITADIIREVLAKPCGLDPDNAETLFESLGRNVSLVNLNPDGSLQHRPDVRRIMLHRMIGSTSYGDTITQIHKAALIYYAAQKPSNPITAGEEAYHLLMLGEVGTKLDDLIRMADRRSLELAWDDPLPPRSRAWLANYLGFKSEEVDWKSAEIDDWERQVKSQVKLLLSTGENKQALKKLKERKERLPGSPLHELQARALEAEGRYAAALKVIATGLSSALEVSNFAEALKLCMVGARVTLRIKDTESFERYLSQGFELAESEEDEAARLMLGKLRLEGRKKLVGEKGTEEEEATSDLIRAFLNTSKEVLQDEDELAGFIIGEIGAENPSVLEHAIITLKPVDPGDAGAEGLAKLLSVADKSEEFRQHRSILFRELGVSDPKASWQEVAQKAIDYGGLYKALKGVVQHGSLGTKDLKSVVQMVASGTQDGVKHRF